MNDKTDAGSNEAENQATWARDQQKRSYYYDDAHGYEIYNPDEDVEDEDDATSATDEHK